jgi:hypothetical protein
MDPATGVHVHPAVAAVRDLYRGLVGECAAGWTRHEHLVRLADRLGEGFQARHPGAAVELANWHAAGAGRAEAELWGLPLEASDFLLTVARQRGYDQLGDVVPDQVVPSKDFEAAIDTLLSGDRTAFAALLDGDRQLSRQASHWPHHATLLHYATANGVETYRQVVPSDLPALVALLVERGADPNATAHAYGRELRPLGLLLSSGHPREAGVADEVATILRSAGAR